MPFDDDFVKAALFAEALDQDRLLRTLKEAGVVFKVPQVEPVVFPVLAYRTVGGEVSGEVELPPDVEAVPSVVPADYPPFEAIPDNED